MAAALARLSVFLRPLLLFLLQTGLFIVLEKWVFPNINETIANIAVKFGVSDDVATDIAANEILNFLESAGVTIATMRSRMPLKLADRLGFTTKGYTRRKLPSEVEAKVKVAKAGKSTVAASAVDVSTELAEATLKRAPQYAAQIKSFFGVVSSILGATGLWWLVIINTIDFGNWNGGAYQHTFQKLFSYIGLEPDKQSVSPRTVSKEMFDAVYAAFLNEGATTITDPKTGARLTYNRVNVSAVVDGLASHILIEKGSVSKKEMLAALVALVNSKSGGTPAVAVSATAAAAAPSTVPQTRVFTGIVSQGVLGAGATFVPRPDDLIESVDELQSAAHNNLSAMLASIGASLSYEIKVQSSVTTKDGFTQRGTTQQVITGYNKNGTPKTKTVTNKFAVLSVFILGEKGTRTKLRTIVLGPTDAIRFQPSGAQLAEVESLVKGSVVTSDVSAIVSIATPQPLASAVQPDVTVLSQNSTAQNGAGATDIGQYDMARANPQAFTAYFPTDGIFRDSSDFGSQLFRRAGNRIYLVDLISAFVPETERSSLGNAGAMGAVAIQRLKDRYGIDYKALPTVLIPDLFYDKTLERSGRAGPDGGQDPIFFVSPNFTAFLALGPTASAGRSSVVLNSGTNAAVPTAAKPAACQAQSLSDFYAARGLALPSVADRASRYASLLLGQAAYYTGTAEQNSKLLAAEKSQLGCSVV